MNSITDSPLVSVGLPARCSICPYPYTAKNRKKNPLSADELSALKAFAGKNSSQYLSIWTAAGTNAQRRYINWAAFLMPFGWCFYRKMFRNGFFMLLFCAASLLTASSLAVAFLCPQMDELLTLNALMKDGDAITAHALFSDYLQQEIFVIVRYGFLLLGLALLPNIIFAFMADSVYLRHAKLKILQASFWYEDYDNQLPVLGGTSRFFLAVSFPAFLAMLYIGYQLIRFLALCFV